MLAKDLSLQLRPRLLALTALFAPCLWRLFESSVKASFGSRAAEWDERVGPHHTTAAERALASPALRSLLDRDSVVLDIGCGTGMGTERIVRILSPRMVVGVDISFEMLSRARSKPELTGPGVHFVVGDASRPPFKRGCASLIMLMNAPPFVRALSELATPKGAMLFVWSEGKKTPIWVDPRLVKKACSRYGLTHFDDGVAGGGYWLLAAGRPP